MFTNHLDAKVAAVNAANKHSKTVYHRLMEFFRPWVGKKIEKADGSLLESVKKNHPDLFEPGGDVLQVYRYAHGNTLSYFIKTCTHYQRNEDVGTNYSYAVYHETYVYIGTIKGQILVALNDTELNGRTNFTADEVKVARAERERYEHLMRNAMNGLSMFGEYDR